MITDVAPNDASRGFLEMCRLSLAGIGCVGPAVQLAIDACARREYIDEFEVREVKRSECFQEYCVCLRRIETRSLIKENDTYCYGIATGYPRVLIPRLRLFAQRALRSCAGGTLR